MPNGAKLWCFTINNYTDDIFPLLDELYDSKQVSYICVAREVGASGTPHLQCCCRFEQRVSFKRAKELLGGDIVHIEQMRGTLDQAAEYCKKDGDYYERGQLKSQGQRQDLTDLQTAVQQGVDMKYLRDNHFKEFLRYGRMLEAALALNAVPRSWKTQVIWIWGPPRCGKSRLAHKEGSSLSNGHLSFIADKSLTWFNGWTPGHKVAILDDFDGTAKINTLLTIFDRYPCKVPVKGNFIEWNPRIVYVTSNYPPQHFYFDKEDWLQALLARIEVIEHMT